VLRPEYADHPDTLDRFRKEARNAGLLTHPHVAQVFDYGPGGADCPPYLVMEFVDGPSLADILAVDSVEPALALDVVAQTADGLSAAHRAGLVHRDVKPGNILIGPGGQVKVTDFGIAHAAGQAPVTGPGLVMGTAQYMAPERIAGSPGTPASDLYALGIVLHECLTGVPPFEGTSADVMAAHLYLPLPPLPASVPVEVDALVGQLTAKDPARRIGDAGEVAAVAARLRDALAPGHLVPSARAHRSGAAVADAVPAGGLAELAAKTPPGLALGLADDAGSPEPGPTGFGRDARGQPGQDPVYVSSEWAVPSRMTSSTAALSREGPVRRNQRQRAAALAVGAAVATGAALAALLLSGALHGSPAANPTPAGSTSASATTAHPRPSAGAGSAGAGSAGATTPAGRSRSNAAGPGTTSPRATRGSTQASPSTSPSRSPSTSPSGSSPGSPSTSPSISPSASPTVSPSPAGSACIAGICL
jgi:eukaryotic-like serine/threonine-protein kinase